MKLGHVPLFFFPLSFSLSYFSAFMCVTINLVGGLFFSLSFALNSFNAAVLIENLHHLCINGHRSYDVDKSILLFFTFACTHFLLIRSYAHHVIDSH